MIKRIIKHNRLSNGVGDAYRSRSGRPDRPPYKSGLSFRIDKIFVIRALVPLRQGVLYQRLLIRSRKLALFCLVVLGR